MTKNKPIREKIVDLLATANDTATPAGERAKLVRQAATLCANHKIGVKHFTWPADADSEDAVAGASPDKAIPRGAIRKFCERELLKTNKAGEGKTYNRLLEMVRARFPAAHTSYACLRWYAADMRRREIDVPPRPEPARIGRSVEQVEA